MAEQLKSSATSELVRSLAAEPGEGFLEWCQLMATKIDNAKTPQERAMAKLLAAIMTAIVETANAVDSDDIGEGAVAVFVPRAAFLASVGALISVLKPETPTAWLRALLVEELDASIALMAPGLTIGEEEVGHG